MIIVRLQGGLGNQMFQYAAGLAASSKRDVPLKLDMTAYGLAAGRSKVQGRFDRAPDILDFEIAASLASDREIEQARYVPFGQLGEKLRQFKYKYLVNYYVGHVEGVLSAYRGRYMDGYFQTERCFIEASVDVRHVYRLKHSLVDAVQPALGRMNDIGTTVSIHVRRGDFVKSEANRLVLNVCDRRYYEHAISYLRSRIGEFVPVIFSDDLEWVRNNLNFGLGAIFADRFGSEDGRKPTTSQELILMSRCSHHIIANSTFSWWGAYLNASPAKIVVAPSVWARGLHGYEDILPPAWVSIPVD